MKVLMSPKNSSIAYFFGSKQKYLAICWYDAIILLCIPSRTSHCSFAIPANWCTSVKDCKMNEKQQSSYSLTNFVLKIKMSLWQTDLCCCTVRVKKIPTWGFLALFPERLGIFPPNFTCLLYVPVYATLQIFIQLLQLWRSYAILRATTEFTSYVQNVHHWLKRIFCHFSQVFTNGWEFLVQILHAYYTFPSTLEYTFSFNYRPLWRSYDVLSATTQRAFRSMVDILSIWCELSGRA